MLTMRERQRSPSCSTSPITDLKREFCTPKWRDTRHNFCSITQKSSYGIIDRYIFQGPALLAFNNATFTEDDFRGIRSMHTSIKQESPLKVGRFGLGFKSVYHLTGTHYRSVLC